MKGNKNMKEKISLFFKNKFLLIFSIFSLCIFISFTTCYASNDEDVNKRTISFAAFNKSKEYTCILPRGYGVDYTSYFIMTDYFYNTYWKYDFYKVYLFLTKGDILFERDSSGSVSCKPAKNDSNDNFISLYVFTYEKNVPTSFDFSNYVVGAGSSVTPNEYPNFSSTNTNLFSAGSYADENRLAYTTGNCFLKDFNDNILFHPAPQEVEQITIPAIQSVGEIPQAMVQVMKILVPVGLIIFGIGLLIYLIKLVISRVQ